MFSHDSPTPLRQEIQDYIKACERLITSQLVPGAPPLTEDEAHMVEFYRTELVPILGEVIQKYGLREPAKK